MTCLNRDENDLRQRIEHLQTDLGVGGGDGLRLIPTYTPGKYYSSPLFNHSSVLADVTFGVRAIPFPIFETVNITGYAYYCTESGDLSNRISMAFYTDNNGTPDAIIPETYSGRIYATSALTTPAFPAWRTIGHVGNADTAPLEVNATLEPGNYWLVSGVTTVNPEEFITASQGWFSNLVPMHHYDVRQILGGYDGTWDEGWTDFSILGRSGETLGGMRAAYGYFRQDIVPLNSENSIDLTLPLQWEGETETLPATHSLLSFRTMQSGQYAGNLRVRETIALHAFARIGAPS